MTTTNINLVNYSKQLAIKLRDPVDDGSADGKLFFAEFRYGYLTRGFGKLIRNLESIGYDLEKIYPQFYSSIDRQIGSDGFLTNIFNTSQYTPTSLNGYTIDLTGLTDDPTFQIYKIIAKGQAEGNRALIPYRGRAIKINNAFEAIHGLSSEHYDATKTTDSFFFFTVNGVVQIIANPTMTAVSLHFLIRNPLPHFSANAGIDLVIPTEFEDLFLALSALEASLDIGESNKVNMYRAEINGELQMLGVGEKIKASKEKTDPIND